MAASHRGSSPLAVLREGYPGGPGDPVSGWPTSSRPLPEPKASAGSGRRDRAVARHSRRVGRGGGPSPSPAGGAVEGVGGAPASEQASPTNALSQRPRRATHAP